MGLFLFQFDHGCEAIGERRGYICGPFFEYSEHGASASAHLCVCGSKVVELLLYVAQYGMELEDGFFKIVCKFVAPCVDGLAYYVAAAFLGPSGCDGSIGLSRGDCHRWLYECQMVAFEIAARCIGWRELFALAGCKGWFGSYEEGTVGTQHCGIAFHFGIANVQVAVFVNELYHKGCIGRAAAEPSLRRYLLVEVGMEPWQAVVAGKQVVGFHHQIVLVAESGKGSRTEFFENTVSRS